MKFSTRTRYGLRMLVYLGSRCGEGYVQLNEIASNEKVSTKYLEQIVILMKPAGILSSSRGAKGGYKLAKEPSKIKLIDIFRILEGSLEPIECLKKNHDCKLKKICPTIDIWAGLSNVIHDYLDGINLDELVDNYHQKHEQEMFYI